VRSGRRNVLLPGNARNILRRVGGARDGGFLRIAAVGVARGVSAWTGEARRRADTKRRVQARYFKLTTIDPSDTFGAARPMPAAFFAIQFLAFSRLSSVPALSLQTVTENPPSSLQTRV
jgi:hypothetical protein